MSNIRSYRKTAMTIAAWLIVVVALAACNTGSSQPTQPPSATEVPPSATALSPTASALDGEALLQARCTVCHTLDRVKQAKKTSDQWDQTVASMIGKGAKLTDDEKAVLVDYLAKTYGP